MVLLGLVALAVGHRHRHIDTLHGSARRTVGYAARHRSGALGEADVGHVAIDDGAVVAFVLNGDAVVVVDARLRRLVGIEQILFAARQACQRLPCLTFLLGAPTLNDVGLGLGVALQVDVPRQFHRAFIDALRSIERVELRALANSLLTDVIGVEHGVAYDTHYAIGSGGAGTQRLLGIGHARRGVHLVLPVGMLVGGAVLPAHGGLVVSRREGVDGFALIVHVDAELVAETLGIGIGSPGEDDAVRQLLRLEVVDGHRAGGVHGDAGLRLVYT